MVTDLERYHKPEDVVYIADECDGLLRDHWITIEPGSGFVLPKVKGAINLKYSHACICLSAHYGAESLWKLSVMFQAPNRSVL